MEHKFVWENQEAEQSSDVAEAWEASYQIGSLLGFENPLKECVHLCMISFFSFSDNPVDKERCKSEPRVVVSNHKSFYSNCLLTINTISP